MVPLIATIYFHLLKPPGKNPENASGDRFPFRPTRENQEIFLSKWKYLKGTPFASGGIQGGSPSRRSGSSRGSPSSAKPPPLSSPRREPAAFAWEDGAIPQHVYQLYYIHMDITLCADV